MPSTYFRKITGVGYIWQNGRYVKRLYLSPAARTIALNLQRLINQDQNEIFDEVAEAEGVVLPREHDDYYFNLASIHAGVTADPNKFALWIKVTKIPKSRKGDRKETYKVTIFITIGSGDFDTQIQLMSVFLEGLNNLLTSMSYKEIVYGWPANIPAEFREDYQPDIDVENAQINDPDTAQGETAETKGPIGSITFDITANPKENKATA